MAKIVSAIMASIIGIVILVSVFVPVIGDAQTTTGDPMTIDNESFYHIPISKYDKDMTIIVDSPLGSTSNATTTITVDGETYAPSAKGGMIFFMASNWYGFLQPTFNTSGVGSVRGYADDGTSITANFAFGQKSTIEYDHATKTTTITTLTYSTETSAVVVSDAPTKAIYGPDPAGGYGYYRANIDGYRLQEMAWTSDTMNSNKFVATGGTVNITVNGVAVVVDYLLSDGVVYAAVSNSQYTVTGEYAITGDSELVNGTTDIYDGVGLELTLTVTKTGTEESTTSTFVPDYGLMLSAAHGHKNSGTAYDLLGVVMIVTIAGALLYIVSIAVLRRE